MLLADSNYKLYEIGKVPFLDNLQLELELRKKHRIIQSNEIGGYVYIFVSEDNLKIGKTKNIIRRYKDLRNMSGKEFIKILVSEPCGNYSEIEFDLHKQFERYKIISEWFNVDFSLVFEAIKKFEIKPIEIKVDEGNNELFDKFFKSMEESLIETVFLKIPKLKDFLIKNNLEIYFCDKCNDIIITDNNEFAETLELFLELNQALYDSHNMKD